MKNIILTGIESNLWKYFCYSLSHRRHYYIYLPIYYLSLPNSTVLDIWIFIAVGNIVWFFMEVPSGYLSDTIGHKKAIVIAAFCMFFSTLLFIVWSGFWGFVIWFIVMTIGWSFHSWSSLAFLHETLEAQWKERDFTKISARIWGNISLISAFLSSILPLFIVFDMRLPLILNAFIDLFWLIIALTFFTPKQTFATEKQSFFEIAKSLFWTWLYPAISFSAVIIGLLFAENTFRPPYLEELWYPIMYIGFIMWLSRLIWFIISRYIHIVEEKFSFKTLLFFDIVFISSVYFLASYFNNPYIVWFLFIVLPGYIWGRKPIFNHYFIKRIPNKKYKATVISIEAIFSKFISFIFSFIFWLIMGYSYKIGFISVWFLIVLFLLITLLFIKDSGEWLNNKITIQK